MSPENTHKLMGFYMKGLILGINTMYMLFCFFKLFLIGCIGLRLCTYTAYSLVSESTKTFDMLYLCKPDAVKTSYSHS